MVGDLGPILDHVPAWLLVLFRLTGIFILSPIFGNAAIPRQIKVMLVVPLSFCVYPMLLDSGRPSAGMIGYVIDEGLTLWLLIALVGLELLVGYVIGFVASLPVIAMQVGGHVIDTQIGLGAAAVLNPDTQDHSGPIGEVFFLLALVIFAILGGHRVILATVVGSFDHVPLGGFNNFADVAGLAVGMTTVMMNLALQIAAPLLCLVFLVQLGMGFIARTVPQINILSVGFALKILAGTAFLVGTVVVIAGAYTNTTRRVLHDLMTFFGN
jgi:flagellar biosynthetic protein FliR